MQKTEIINIRLPGELVKKLDSIIQQKTFNTRSEAIRHFLREYAEHQKTRIRGKTE